MFRRGEYVGEHAKDIQGILAFNACWSFLFSYLFVWDFDEIYMLSLWWNENTFVYQVIQN
jgi:hypothetical protein